VPRLLIVEDSPTQAASLRFLLEGDGYEVAEARDGAEALARLRERPFDMVVSDVVMPGMDGYALCRAVRADAALGDLPVLLLTSLEDPMDVIRALECGASGFMRKPFDPALLLRRVRELLEAARRRAGGGANEEFAFRGQRVQVASSRAQVLDLLLCALDDLLHANDTLEASRARLEEANAELESFSYSVSHDLRAPLRAIDGFSAALAEEVGDGLEGPARGYLERVRAGARRMGALIDAMLELSRVSRAPLRRAEVDLSALAEEVAQELRDSAPERVVTVDVQPGMTTRGDPALLRALLANLLSNAVKFTAGRPDAHVEVRRRTADGEVVYEVRDNGAGFDMAQAHRLFVPFSRLHPEHEFAGTGIGLATVQRIVRRHGGRVWAESGPSGGATFSFTVGERAPG
jgi:signal transduction histidine kinase